MQVISNSGPIIALSKIGLLDILEAIYGNILIPDAVYNEVMDTRYQGTIQLDQFPWLHKKNVNEIDSLLLKALDLGEASAIALTIQCKGELLLIDERKGRRFAEQIYGLNIIGTAGLLLIAKKKEIVSSIKPLFERLIVERYFISQEIIQDTCKLAGE
jgi:predicted nucleic acid-binding protein